MLVRAQHDWLFLGHSVEKRNLEANSVLNFLETIFADF